MESITEFIFAENFIRVIRTGESRCDRQMRTNDEILPSVILSKFPSPDWAFIAPYKSGKIFAEIKSRIFLHLVLFRIQNIFVVFLYDFCIFLDSK